MNLFGGGGRRSKRSSDDESDKKKKKSFLPTKSLARLDLEKTKSLE